MNRAVLTTNFGENKLRHTVRVEAFPSSAEGQPGFAGLMDFMLALRDQPDLLRHGGNCPETVKFFHDGERWVVEAVTVVPRPSEG